MIVMWNLKDINSKKTYITERLKNCSNPKEKEKPNTNITLDDDDDDDEFFDDFFDN